MVFEIPDNLNLTKLPSSGKHFNFTPDFSNLVIIQNKLPFPRWFKNEDSTVYDINYAVLAFFSSYLTNVQYLSVGENDLIELPDEIGMKNT